MAIKRQHWREQKNAIYHMHVAHTANRIVNFHAYMRQQLHDDFARADDTPDRETHKASLAWMDDQLAINTFLMLFAHIEEYLAHMKAEHVGLAVDEASGSGLDRFKPWLKALGFVFQSEQWQQLKAAAAIRDCLLHANGRISIVKPSRLATLQSAMVRNASFVVEIDGRLRLKVGYAEHFRQLVDSLQQVIHDLQRESIRRVFTESEGPDTSAPGGHDARQREQTADDSDQPA